MFPCRCRQVVSRTHFLTGFDLGKNGLPRRDLANDLTSSLYYTSNNTTVSQNQFDSTIRDIPVPVLYMYSPVLPAVLGRILGERTEALEPVKVQLLIGRALPQGYASGSNDFYLQAKQVLAVDCLASTHFEALSNSHTKPARIGNGLHVE